MGNAGYIAPPREPDGGWKNDAQWIGNVEYWSEEMMKLGYTLSDIEGIYQKDIGERFPKNLHNSIKAKNWLFPGADMLQQYDLQNKMKRSMPHKNADYPEGTGYGDWTAMDPSEITAANQYTDFRNNPANASKFPGTAQDPEGNPYEAWLAQWGDKFKDPGWAPSTNASSRMVPMDKYGKPLGGNTPTTPTTTPPGTSNPIPPPPTPPPGPIGPIDPPDPLAPAGGTAYHGVAPTSLSGSKGFGYNPMVGGPKMNTNIDPNLNLTGWGNTGINDVRRRRVNNNTGTSPLWTY